MLFIPRVQLKHLISNAFFSLFPNIQQQCLITTALLGVAVPPSILILAKMESSPFLHFRPNFSHHSSSFTQQPKSYRLPSHQMYKCLIPTISPSSLSQSGSYPSKVLHLLPLLFPFIFKLYIYFFSHKYLIPPMWDRHASMSRKDKWGERRKKKKKGIKAQRVKPPTPIQAIDSMLLNTKPRTT